MSRTSGPLVNITGEAHHTFSPWIGQRSATFRFELVNGVTGQFLGELTPIQGASLSHDVSRTIKRSLQMDLGAADTAAINPVTDRVDLYMVFDQEQSHEHPLGRYVFVDNTRQVFTSGQLSSPALTDEMFIVDQQLDTGISANQRPVPNVIASVLAGMATPPKYTIEASSFISVEAWAAGTGRGQVLEALALTGDYFSPWFGNDKEMHFIRSFDPIKQIPDFDFDASGNVNRIGITKTDNLLTAPNRFIVVSNAAVDPSVAVVGIADVPVTAPHSIVNRGFVVPSLVNLQVANSRQATAIAANLALRSTVFEQVSLTTAPDPLHDSYNVIRWQGELWLETSWSMPLVEGSSMRHLLRRAYL